MSDGAQATNVPIFLPTTSHLQTARKLDDLTNEIRDLSALLRATGTVDKTTTAWKRLARATTNFDVAADLLVQLVHELDGTNTTQGDDHAS